MNRRSNTIIHTRGWQLATVSMALCGVMMLGACAMDEATDADGQWNAGVGGAGESETLHAAEAQLENHRVDEARALYEVHLEDYPGDGRAAAGLGVTDLMLVLGMDEMTELFVEHLGASSGLDANGLLYAEGGYLYWRSRGARWVDDGQSGEGYGVMTLLGDELPWASQRLESLAAFVEGFDDPVNPLIRQLRSVTTGLKEIDAHLEMAIEDGEFNRLYVPGEVFHDTDLALQLGRGELSMLRAVIALTRGAVYFLEAYEHQWTLEGAFGSWRWNVGLDDSSYVPGFGSADYTVDYLDRHLLREVTHPDRLAASRLALRDGIHHLRKAIHHGVGQSYSTTLAWADLDEEYAYEMDQFLEALADGLDGPTPLPHVDGVTIDLSPLFEDGGRSLDEDIDWFAPHVDPEGTMDGSEDLDEARAHWTISEEALQVFWLEGIVDPLPQDEAQLAHLAGPQGGAVAFMEILIGEYRQAMKDVYMQTR